MNDSALKSFCTWARTELIKGVEAQMVRYGITEPAPAPVGSETVSGLPLSPAEIEQRDELLRMQAEVGHEVLRDRAATPGSTASWPFALWMHADGFPAACAY